MPADVVVPDLGEIIEQVRIVRWVKAEGETVVEGDDLVEITTDKIDVMIASPASGVVGAIRVAAGDRAPVGAILASIT